MYKWFLNVLWVNKDIKAVCFLIPRRRTHKYDAKMKFLLIVRKVWLFYRCLSMITRKGKLISWSFNVSKGPRCQAVNSIYKSGTHIRSQGWRCRFWNQGKLLKSHKKWIPMENQCISEAMERIKPLPPAWREGRAISFLSKSGHGERQNLKIEVI